MAESSFGFTEGSFFSVKWPKALDVSILISNKQKELNEFIKNGEAKDII